MSRSDRRGASVNMSDAAGGHPLQICGLFVRDWNQCSITKRSTTYQLSPRADSTRFLSPGPAWCLARNKNTYTEWNHLSSQDLDRLWAPRTEVPVGHSRSVPVVGIPGMAEQLKSQIGDTRSHLLVPRRDEGLTFLEETVGGERTKGWRLRISFSPARQSRPTRSFDDHELLGKVVFGPIPQTRQHTNVNALAMRPSATSSGRTTLPCRPRSCAASGGINVVNTIIGFRFP